MSRRREAAPALGLRSLLNDPASRQGRMRGGGGGGGGGGGLPMRVSASGDLASHLPVPAPPGQSLRVSGTHAVISCQSPSQTLCKDGRHDCYQRVKPNCLSRHLEAGCSIGHVQYNAVSSILVDQTGTKLHQWFFSNIVYDILSSFSSHGF